jgi:hypothetical protein
MRTLVILQGPSSQADQTFSLGNRSAIIGRDPAADVSLVSQAVSRRHVQISYLNGTYFVEDLGSRNGTYLNDQRITGRVALTERDHLRVGDYVLALQPASPAASATALNRPAPGAGPAPNAGQARGAGSAPGAGLPTLSPPALGAGLPTSPPLLETDLVVRERVEVDTNNPTLYSHHPAQKLQMVLELSQHLSLTLDQQPLLDQLLGHLLKLFPQADQGMVVLCEKERLMVRAQRSRLGDQDVDFPYSRTIVKQALADGVALLSEDVQTDLRFAASATLKDMDARSLLCVPLLGHDARRLGVVQLACVRPGSFFQGEDLRLLITVGLQVAVVLENQALNAERVREAQLHKELAMAREIQEGFLPDHFTPLPGGGYELHARVCPARDVSGDLYDFFPTADGRLAFFLGDVSGKGMPAALFMFAVHALSHYLAGSAGSSNSPAEPAR